MKIWLHIFIMCFFIFITTSCSDGSMTYSSSKTVKNSAIKWFSGNYTLKSKYGNYYENWKMIDSINYFGLGFYMDTTNVDTLFRQRMTLTKKLNDVFMYFNVKNQNGDKDVEFKLTKHDGNLFIFENPFRDYPSIINYKILSDTAVNVVMLGFKDNEQKKEDFIITKSK